MEKLDKDIFGGSIGGPIMKDRVFFYEYIYDKKVGRAVSHRTMVYDVRSNAFIDLKPKRQPVGFKHRQRDRRRAKDR